MIIDTGNAEHYAWGEGCDGWHFVRTPELSIISERMPPGTWEHLHFHARARQFFFVLEGELMLEVEGAEHRLTRGQGIEIAPGQRHQVRNEGGGEVRFLVTSQPPSHGDRIDVASV